VYEQYLAFANSLNGGANWSAWVIPQEIHGLADMVYDTTLPYWNGKPYTFPTMAVDQQTGDTVFVAFPNRGVPGNYNEGDLPDIYFIRSDDNGYHWSTPIRVNRDTTFSQWMSWLSRDPVTGDLSCIFYDGRDQSVNYIGLPYLAVSYNGGRYWVDGLIGDTTDSIYAANVWPPDYIGIDSYDGSVVGVWNTVDTGGGLRLPWAAQINIDTSCCCVDHRGNVDNGPDETPDIGDWTRLNVYIVTGIEPVCMKEADVDADGNVDSDDLDSLWQLLWVPLDSVPLCDPPP
jgi:hypothetical protein